MFVFQTQTHVSKVGRKFPFYWSLIPEKQWQHQTHIQKYRRWLLGWDLHASSTSLDDRHRSVALVGQRSRQNAADVQLCPLSLTGSGQTEHFGLPLALRTSGLVIRSIVQHFSRTSCFRWWGDLLKWKHNLKLLCLFHSSSSKTVPA